jgi:carboxymethylenebutenolidase
MRNFSVFALTLAVNFVLAQGSCCLKPSADRKFANLVLDSAFVRSHEDPLPFVLDDPIGKEIIFPTPDGGKSTAYSISQPGSRKYVLVVHEWWGLNDYIRKESAHIFRTLGDVNVLAIDLYDGKVATSRDSASAYMGRVKRERAEAIIKGAMDFAGKDAQMATIGWCFGGGWSLQASILAGSRSKACVMFYGMPEEDSGKLKTLQAPVLFIWPLQDKWINREVVNRFEALMKENGKQLEVRSYDADHGFANPSNPHFNNKFAEDAFDQAFAFLKKNLKN